MALLLPHSIFFHVPKTGGTWVRAAIKEAGIETNEVSGPLPADSLNLNDIHHCGPDDLQDQGRFSFAFVRHPLTYYQSYWAYKMKKGKKDYNAFDQECMREQFDAFVLTVLTAHPGWVTKAYDRYVGPYGKKMHFVGKQENLEDDLVRALRLSGELFDEKALRATPRKNPGSLSERLSKKCQYTPELSAAVCEVEKGAIEMFGYSEMQQSLDPSLESREPIQLTSHV